MSFECISHEQGGAKQLVTFLNYIFALSLGISLGCGGDKNVLSRRTEPVAKAPAKQPTSPPPTVPAENTDPTVNPGLKLTETEAFERSLYPLLKEHCGTCHSSALAPLLGQSDIEKARLAVIESGKVNYKEVMSSRLYLRLAIDKHECWGDCSANAEELKAALEQWVRLLLTINPSLLDETNQAKLTDAKNIARAEQRQLAPDTKTISVEAETGTLTAPFVIRNDATLGINYIEIPSNTPGGRLNNANQQGTGGAVFTLMAPVAGKYQVWARLNAPADANDEMFIRVDNGPFDEWKAPVTMAHWVWVAANKNNGREALSLDLTAGSHTITLRRREVGLKIDAIALTSNTEFDGSQLDTHPVQVLRYDISSLSGKPNTFFEIEVSKYSDDSLKLRHPTIVSDVAMRIKDIRVLVNGKYNPQHNTFNRLDVEVVPPMTRLSKAAMIVLEDIDLEQDKLSFSFGSIE